MYRTAGVVGFLLLVVALVVFLGDTEGESRRLPTQVLPQRLAKYPAVAGAALIVISVIGSAFR